MNHKYSLFLATLFAASSSFANPNTEVATEEITSDVESSITEQLEDASSGVGRFRGGWFFGGGALGASGDELYPIRGLNIEAGGYGMFNPIRNFADFEVGLKGSYTLPMSLNSKNQKTGSTESRHYRGLSTISAYSGLVFRFKSGGSALGAGIYKDFLTKESKSDDVKKLNAPDIEFKKGIGLYAEYQHAMTEKNIGYLRLSAGTMEAKEKNNPNALTEKQKVFSISIGLKR